MIDHFLRRVARLALAQGLQDRRVLFVRGLQVAERGKCVSTVDPGAKADAQQFLAQWRTRWAEVASVQPSYAPDWDGLKGERAANSAS